MSVLIRGMEMPKSCHECVAGYGGCCYVAPPEADGICPDSGRADFCPLVPIPPHGRLGDLDMVEAMIMEYIEEYGATKDENGYYSEKWCAMTEAERVIQAAPTIIEAEGRE